MDRSLARFPKVTILFSCRLSVNLNDLETSALLHNGGGASEEYENLRRRIYSNTKEIWYFVNYELTKLIKDGVQPDKIQAILDQVADRKR